MRGLEEHTKTELCLWSLHESVHDLEHFFMALFIFNVIHMYLAGASGYGLYTTLFQHFMADNMSRYGAYLTLTGIEKVPYRPVYGIKMLARLR